MACIKIKNPMFEIPDLNSVINFRLPLHLKDDLDLIAVKEDTSTAALLRKLIRGYVKKYNKA